MWYIEKEISHHKKCICVLEMIKIINSRVLGNPVLLEKTIKIDFLNLAEHYRKRKEIDEKIKKRLENYYLTLIEKK